MTRKKIDIASFRPLVLASLLLAAACTGKQEGSIPEASSSEEAPVVWVDDRPVTESDLKRFDKAHISSAHMGGRRPDPSLHDLVDAYVRRYAIVKEGLRRGFDRDTRVASAARLFTLQLLATQFSDKLVQEAVIPPERLARELPSQWTEMNFRLYVFPTMKDAQEAYDRAAATGSVGPAAIKALSVGGKAEPETGMVFPKSGFFNEADDIYLFSLKEGEYSRPVETGVGAAVAFVKERHDYTPEEQIAALGEKRGALNLHYGRAAAQAKARQFVFTLDEDALRTAALGEAEGRGLYDRPVAIFDPGRLTVTYADYRQFGNPNVAWIVRNNGRDKVVPMVRAELSSFLDQVALGLAAEKDGFVSPDPADFDGKVREKAEDLLYERTSQAIYEENSVSEVSTTDVRRAYDDNPARFSSKATVRIQYYYTPFEEVSRTLWSRHQGGRTPFEALGAGLTQSSGGMHGNTESRLDVRERTIARGDGDMLVIQPDLFAMSLNEVRLVPSNMGFYLVKLLDRTVEGMQSFEDVKGRIAGELARNVAKAGSQRVVDALVNGVRVKWSDRPVPTEGLPVPPDADRS